MAVEAKAGAVLSPGPGPLTAAAAGGGGTQPQPQPPPAQPAQPETMQWMPGCGKPSPPPGGALGTVSRRGRCSMVVLRRTLGCLVVP